MRTRRRRPDDADDGRVLEPTCAFDAAAEVIGSGFGSRRLVIPTVHVHA
jgi:hypothetical protein